MILVFASPPVTLNLFGLTWNILLTMLFLFLPSHTFKLNKSPKWFNSNVRHHLNCIHSLRRKYQHHPSTQLKSKLRLSELSIQESMTSANHLMKNSLSSILPTLTVTKFWIISIVLPTTQLYLILMIKMPLQIPRRLVRQRILYSIFLTAHLIFPLSFWIISN